MKNLDDIHSKVCPVCGKTFVVSPYGWAYKIKKKQNNYTYFCSYSCLNRELDRKERGGRRHKEYLRGLQQILFERELSIKTAAKLCGMHWSQMRGYVYLESAATAPVIEKISRGLGVSAEELIGKKKKKGGRMNVEGN